VDIINGPFSAEYGDFSGLGVVHIRTRESMPDVWTVRLQGGSFGSERGFFSFSPELKQGDALFAYEGSHTDGPFQSPLRYTRHNLTGSFTQRLYPQQARVPLDASTRDHAHVTNGARGTYIPSQRQIARSNAVRFLIAEPMAGLSPIARWSGCRPGRLAPCRAPSGITGASAGRPA
jgi:hypothetical protein